MKSEDGIYLICDESPCTNKIKNHAWGKIKADGWFTGKDNVTAFCPVHIPDWVMEWRKRKSNA